MTKIISDYQLLEVIGQGFFGKVYKAVKKQNQKEFAIKVIPVQKFEQNKKLQQCTINQINILTHIKANEHIVRYYDLLRTKNNIYFIYEYCNGGTLSNLLERQGPLSEKKVLQIFAQLLEAFKILNQANVMHRDLKPDNILFHNGIVKIGDFGFCKYLSSSSMTQTMLGSPIYMAPEVLRGQKYSSKADIWSLGCVLYEMLFNDTPYKSDSIAKLIRIHQNFDFSIPKSVSPLIKDLLTQMLTKDPFKRINWFELFSINIKKDGKINDKNHYITLEDAIQIRNCQTQNQFQQKFKLQTKTQENKKQPFEKQTSILKKQAQIQLVHCKVLQGIKLSMDILTSRMSNYMGFGSIVLRKTAEILHEQQKKCLNQEIKEILQIQLAGLKKENDLLVKKMFNFELKEIQDWKKYSKGKYLGQQRTMVLWFRMICYLEGKQLPKQKLTNLEMSYFIRKILY